MIRQFLDHADQLFIGEIDLNGFIHNCDQFRYSWITIYLIIDNIIKYHQMS
jgi:hypothetical protein